MNETIRNSVKRYADIILLFYFTLMIYKFIGDGSTIWKGYIFVDDPRISGVDFRQFYIYVKELIFENKALELWIYPPFATYFLLPHIFLPENYAYVFHCLILVFVFYYSLKISLNSFFSDSNVVLEILLIFSLILFYSYPVSFSFERGNSDLIAIYLTMLFVSFYKKNKNVKAIFALVLATQLKIYPLFFAFLFFNKKDYKYFLGFGLINFLLLFSTGLTPLSNFLSSLASTSNAPYVWAGNHSLHSFLMIFIKNFHLSTDIFLPAKIIFSLIFFVFWSKSLILYNIQRTDRNLINFILNCLLLSCIVIPVSHDYKLVILFPILLVDLFYKINFENHKVSQIAISFVLFSSLLFSVSLGNYYYNTKFLWLLLIFLNTHLLNKEGFKTIVTAVKN